MQCALRCRRHISDENQRTLLTYYYSLSKEAKDIYLLSLIK